MSRRLRLLIVDDESSFTRLLKLGLEQTGQYEVRTEHQGRQAAGAAREFQPDLILLDVVMPDVSGIDVAMQLAADASLRAIPLLFLTAMPPRAMPMPESLKRVPTLRKPVSLDVLLARLPQYLSSTAPPTPSSKVE